MNTARSAAALVALGGLLLAGCSSSDDATSDGTAADGSISTVASGKLTVCTNPPFEPFELEKDGEIVGFDMALVGEVAADLDLELAPLATGFDGIESGAALNAGQCDIVASGITITDERKANMDFSEPYFDADQGLLVAEGSDLSTLESLEGKTIAVQVATTGAAWAEENGLQSVVFDDLGAQVQALQTGQVDAVINDVATLSPFISDGFEVAANFSTGEQYGFGVKKGNTALVNAINTTLVRLETAGTYDELYTEWIGTAPAEG